MQPNAHSFSALIDTCPKRGDVDAAVRASNRMEQANVDGDIVMYGSILDAGAKADDGTRAKHLSL